MDDESIIALYWQRDQRAITETDTKYGALCRTVASGILRDREDTEECVSDAYLAAWNAIPPRRPQRFRAYICTVVRNISVSRVREKCLKRRGGGEYPAALDELDECTAGSGSDPAPRRAEGACFVYRRFPLRPLSRRAENIHVPLLACGFRCKNGGAHRMQRSKGQDLATPNAQKAAKAP